MVLLRSQNLIPLTSGAYQARDAIANYLICENLFPEINPENAGPDVPVTHYPREGKRFLSAPPTPGRGRGVFCASNGALYAVVGQSVYAIDASWKWSSAPIGTLSYPLSTPVSMSDNGTTAVIVDGSPLGYKFSLIGVAGLIGTLGSITGGTGGVAGTYSDTALTGGSGSGATANITVAGGAVTVVTIVNPGINYAIGDTLSALSSQIGGVTGFSVPVATTTSAAASGGFAAIVDPTGTFVGATRVDFADTFMAFNNPGTNAWVVANPNSVTFNALQTANKDSAPDPIVTLAFNLRQAWLIGSKSSEVWYLAGSVPFPYQEWPNTFVPYGCVAPYSLVQADVNLYWLSRNPQGQALAVETKGYGVKAISTRALEYEWSTYTRIDDCIGMTFQQGGHTFVIFHFPTADVTWAYDLATEQWHKRTFTDNNGVQHRESVAFCASVGGYRAPESAIAPTPQLGYPTTIVGQDWANGSIYALDPLYHSDNCAPIVFRRTFPHQMVDMKEITHVSFIADFASGGIKFEGCSWYGPQPVTPNPPTQGYKIIFADPTCHVYQSTDVGFNTFTSTLAPTGSLDTWQGVFMAYNDGDYNTLAAVDTTVDTSYGGTFTGGQRGGVEICTVATYPTAPILDFYLPTGVTNNYVDTIASAITANAAKIMVVGMRRSIGPVNVPRLSTDGGATFNSVSLTPAAGWVGCAFSHNAAIMYAQQFEGQMYKSTDGGTTWSLLSSSPTVPLTTNSPVSPGIYNLRCSQNGSIVVLTYQTASVGASDQLVYVSQDAGATWTLALDMGSQIGGGPYVWGGGFGMNQSGNIIVACASYSSGNTDHNLKGIAWKSTDFGATWVQLPLTSNPWKGATSCNVSPDGLAIVVGSAPVLDFVHETATSFVNFSLDGGATFTERSFLQDPNSFGNLISAWILPNGMISTAVPFPGNPQVPTAIPPGLNQPPNSLYARYSNDGGHTWSNYRPKGLIENGEYRSMMRWRGLGMARDRVYELMWVYPGPSALQGAYLEPIMHGA